METKIFLFPDSKEKGIANGLKLNQRLIFQTTALGLIMITSALTGANSTDSSWQVGVASIPNISPEFIEIKAPTSQSESQFENTGKTEKRMTVEKYVRNYFSDIPVMIEIAKCESRFRQHDISGDVLHGEKNSLDRGVMQINEFYHNENSDKLGYDIMTLEGNTSYARYLFEKYGVKPWVSSAKCWGKTVAYSEYKQLATNK